MVVVVVTSIAIAIVDRYCFIIVVDVVDIVIVVVVVIIIVVVVGTCSLKQQKIK